MQHCYALSPIGSQSCPVSDHNYLFSAHGMQVFTLLQQERDGFLIHGGDGTSCAAGNPSDGCIVIEDAAVRQKIKGGGTLHVVE
jgi:hypothetical protein